ncbi:Hypothetical predicted protein [Pelobates cultripes]|uniref:Uncharacterized protein n=1 Tax=Pelobates cultripes TaxID=61616 RepID=A0AAD1RD82_PELCU|nr:Hypothetical predicted protein [Pelobates cultripes]
MYSRFRARSSPNPAVQMPPVTVAPSDLPLIRDGHMTKHRPQQEVMQDTRTQRAFYSHGYSVTVCPGFTQCRDSVGFHEFCELFYCSRTQYHRLPLNLKY